ncbi:TPA: phage head closure protein [Staphylococcus aureus]|uniref:ORF043 n=9 Tax=root TaxID=1 RepID=Q4ZBB4_9CAUD|nr:MULTISPECIES: phage head closure protein [Staphylococcus]YP_001604138.1 putative head-tail adaptor [Staphylococcus phage phiMR11]YP_240462.1 head closure protein [Staphylococcus phage 55]YP_240679.1 head closure protein [Staphylococcus phage 88]YP_240752.1 head closure protein [Staphylococcus phage 92]AKO62015.1 head-tail adaptor [Staphylococcus phage 55-2]AKO62080.1 head-tail adaptor [Staphylococcus phage 55-3]EGS88722.1 putative phage head-tail adaptor [Staphylococcus aureus subsp. aure
MFNPFDEFPHTIEIGEVEVVGTYPKEYERFKSNETIKGFMDTPTSSETLKFHQMSKDFDRNLYTPYHIPITNKTLFNYEGKTYEVVGEPVDQGGQHEINLTRLRVRPIGKG